MIVAKLGLAERVEPQPPPLARAPKRVARAGAPDTRYPREEIVRVLEATRDRSPAPSSNARAARVPAQGGPARHRARQARSVPARPAGRLEVCRKQRGIPATR